MHLCMSGSVTLPLRPSPIMYQHPLGEEHPSLHTHPCLRCHYPQTIFQVRPNGVFGSARISSLSCTELMHMQPVLFLMGATVCGLMQWLKRFQGDRMVKRYKHAYFNPGVLTVWCLCVSMSLEPHWHGLLVAVQGQRCICETASCTLVTAVTTKLMPQFTSR